MKTALLVVAVAFALTNISCSSWYTKDRTGATVYKKERNGSSYEKALIIEANTTTAGLRAERFVLAKCFSGYKILSTVYSEYNGNPYHIITVKTLESERIMYFDIYRF